MMAQCNDTPSLDGKPIHSISLILAIFREEYPVATTSLEEILHDVVDLYEGRWPGFEACQVGYHTLQHSTDVALLVARIVAGWNRTEIGTFSQDHFVTVVTAALFHDCGYIKDRGDQVGFGGKFTFSHVERSKKISADYLKTRDWPLSRIAQVEDLIDATDFHQTVDLEKSYPDSVMSQLASILGTADLIAQMSDVNYIANIHALFQEMEEAYSVVGRDQLEGQGHRIFDSADAILNETVDFYENNVLPRLRNFGNVYQYLGNFFGDGRNFYLESIIANLSGKLLDSDSQWQRIGSILTSLGAITQDQLTEALRRQQSLEQPRPQPPPLSFQRRFLNWSNGNTEKKTLGDILIVMGAISPTTLSQGLVSQVLPPKDFAQLNHDQLELLLRTSVMLHGACHDPWIFQQIISLGAKQLGCAGGSILLAVPDRQEMVVAVSTLLTREHFEGKIIPADKGLAGWVFTHGQPAIVNSIDTDTRIEKSLDRRTPSPPPKSILAVPMCHNHGSFGVFEMYSKPNGFTERDASLLLMVANIIAVALDTILVMP